MQQVDARAHVPDKPDKLLYGLASDSLKLSRFKRDEPARKFCNLILAIKFLLKFFAISLPDVVISLCDRFQSFSHTSKFGNCLANVLALGPRFLFCPVLSGFPRFPHLNLLLSIKLFTRLLISSKVSGFFRFL